MFEKIERLLGQRLIYGFGFGMTYSPGRSRAR
jgi:hypothetical protein